MEGERSLEINVISARDIKNVKVFSKMNVYVVVSLTGGPTKKKLEKVNTPVDREGGVNPTWNFPVKLRVVESLAQRNPLYVVFKLKCEGALGDKLIGEVNVPVKELLDEYYKIKAAADLNNKLPLSFLSYQVRTPSGKPQGELNFSYKFTDEIPATSSIPKAIQQQPEPVTAYPAVPPVGPSSSASAPPYNYAYNYPPPPPATGYPYSPYPPPPYYSQPGYTYPGQAGYGYYYPQQPQQKKNNKLGLGLGAGLLGGVLGGLLLGDLVSDVGSYDAGYDAGFGDAGGF